MRPTTSDSISRIAALVDRLCRMTRGLQHARGIKPAQWSALRYLAHANDHSRSPGALADFLGSTRGTVSQTLIALERKHLIAREPSPSDRRSTNLTLTPAGWALIAEDPLSRLEGALAKLPPSTRDALADGLSALSAELHRNNGFRRFGECGPCRYFQRGDGSGDDPHFCLSRGDRVGVVDTNLLCREFEPAAAPLRAS
jgi:DNA-binding MarR family transcriptional regulator